jgi:hypothetical protein
MDVQFDNNWSAETAKHDGEQTSSDQRNQNQPDYGHISRNAAVSRDGSQVVANGEVSSTPDSRLVNLAKPAGREKSAKGSIGVIGSVPILGTSPQRLLSCSLRVRTA